VQAIAFLSASISHDLGGAGLFVDAFFTFEIDRCGWKSA
jgi:hypothetical protein